LSTLIVLSQARTITGCLRRWPGWIGGVERARRRNYVNTGGGLAPRKASSRSITRRR
jgi:hypothetical protein